MSREDDQESKAALSLEHVSPATRLLEKRRQMFEVQEALDAPTVHSEHFPSSFYPRRGFPAQVAAEERLPAEVLSELERRGHQIVKKEGWSHGKVLGIRRDSDRGLIHGAAAAKNNIGYALGW